MNARRIILAETDNALLEPGQSSLLDAGGTVLRIIDGSLDVYAVKDAGGFKQKKVFLCERKQGDALFSLPREQADGLLLMITAPKGANVLVTTQNKLLSTVAGGEHGLATIRSMLENWLGALFNVAALTAPPRSSVPIDNNQTVEVKANQVIRAHKDSTWIKINRGAFRYNLLPEYTLPVGAVLPLAGNGWLTAAEDGGEVTGMTAGQIFPASLCDAPAVFWRPFQDCQEFALNILRQKFTLADARSSAQLQNRRTQKEKLLRSAASNLLKSNAPDLLPVTGSGSGGQMVDAVKMLAGFLGVPEDGVRLSSGMESSRRDAFALKNIAKNAGIQVRHVKLEEGWHRQDAGALLSGLEPDEKLTVLLPVAPGKYLMYDMDGTYREITDETARQIPRDAYVFYTAPAGKSVTLTGWLKFMLGKCWKTDFYTLILTSMLAGIIAIITPLVTKTIFNDIIPVYDRQGHLMVVQVMIVSSFATAGVGFTRSIAVLRLRSRSLMTAEAAMWIRLLSLPATFFRRFETGDLVQRISGMTKIASLLSTSAISTVFNSVFSFWSLLIMLHYNWQLALASMFVWLLYFGIFSALAWRLMGANRRAAEAAGETAGQVLQIFNGLSKFRLKNSEPQAYHLWARKFGEQWHWNYKAIRRGNLLELLTVLQPVCLSMLIFGLTVYLFEGADIGLSISHPDFMGFYTALGGFNAAITGMVPVLLGILRTIPILERIRPVLEAEPEAADNKAEAGELTGHIEINNVSFRYSSDQPLVLRDFSMTVPPGKFAAIVGASGSGKSTLLRLLLGFEKPESGSICYDGQNISELKLSSLRSQMGVVLQNGQIMSGSIFSNIIGSLPLTQDDAWEAAEMAGLAEDIRQMPMKMNTVISEGATNISGGQRQRILIARAIVHRPRIIFFDEGTSSLDNRTQAIVTESLARLKATRIIVAHRLSTIIDADVIYVIDKGGIAESGSYEELMQKNGLFASLAKRQMI